MRDPGLVAPLPALHSLRRIEIRSTCPWPPGPSPRSRRRLAAGGCARGSWRGSSTTDRWRVQPGAFVRGGRARPDGARVCSSPRQSSSRPRGPDLSTQTRHGTDHAGRRTEARPANVVDFRGRAREHFDHGTLAERVRERRIFKPPRSGQELTRTQIAARVSDKVLSGSLHPLRRQGVARRLMGESARA